MLYRAWYKGKMWNVESLYLRKPEMLGARLGRINNKGVYEWEFTNTGDFILSRNSGLFDKNNLPIFDHDIIKYKLMGNEVFEAVSWNRERAGFTPFIGVSIPPDWIHVNPQYVEVVGTIFTHSSLLKPTSSTK